MSSIKSELPADASRASAWSGNGRLNIIRVGIRSTLSRQQPGKDPWSPEPPAAVKPACWAPLIWALKAVPSSGAAAKRRRCLPCLDKPASRRFGRAKGRITTIPFHAKAIGEKEPSVAVATLLHRGAPPRTAPGQRKKRMWLLTVDARAYRAGPQLQGEFRELTLPDQAIRAFSGSEKATVGSASSPVRH